MNAMLKQLNRMTDDEVLLLAEAIDSEWERRRELENAAYESARRRALLRDRSYRRDVGSTAPPIRAVGLRNPRGRGRGIPVGAAAGWH